MPNPNDLIELAFKALAAMRGYSERRDQVQLALLLSDCIESGSRGAFEAPTGLGKSLAALIPAIAQNLCNDKRTIIATYTNVLAEQYWRQDLPVAMGLFPGSGVKAQFLIGKARYACHAEMQPEASQRSLAGLEGAKDLLVSNRRDLDAFAATGELGIESEFRQFLSRPGRELNQIWQQISAPPVCPARLCPKYHDCFHYRARRGAERAGVVITNHSVALQDALLRKASEGELTLLGDYDFLILDEAHDFPQAAQNGLEFEVSEGKLGLLQGLVTKLERSVGAIAARAGGDERLADLCEGFRKELERGKRALHAYGLAVGRSGILNASPLDLRAHPQVKAAASVEGLRQAKELASEIAANASNFIQEVDLLVKSWREEERVEKPLADEARDTISGYGMYLREFAYGCGALFRTAAEGDGDVAVTYTSALESGAQIRRDIIDLAEPLRDLLWSQAPYACLSATLALDGTFDYFKRVTGAEPEFEEILPSPFDYASQAALYLPRADQIPDPSTARREGREQEYYLALASELTQIITLLGGRTLALFHSRKEMEGVYMNMSLPPELPIYMQRRAGVASVGEKFKNNTHASLFALRSFWTGFDAPGETLSCVCLVRVPFEVPVDPPQIARMAWLQNRGLNPFGAHSLPQAKMLMRQGAGRLIRRAEDRGLIAILDPRLRTKTYGEEILANLPEGMRCFDDVPDAVGWLGLGGDRPPSPERVAESR
ncbi:MAG TPA: ATP-dependent DNA helicase [Fimbriimonadaceae bacterium]|nr:ATP-dependent DNA helicase [Fimbriimonadaceae bacterium]